MGPPGGPIFGTVFRFIFITFFASGLQKRNVLVSTQTLWLMATGKATREALLSEAGFEKVSRTQNWVRRSKLFCRWFCSLLGQAGCISVASSNPVEVSFLLFGFVWWLDFLLLKEGPSAFCSVRWLLEVFLVVAEFAGFSRRWPASIWMIVLNTLLPLVGPPCPL